MIHQVGEGRADENNPGKDPLLENEPNKKHYKKKDYLTPKKKFIVKTFND